MVLSAEHLETDVRANLISQTKKGEEDRGRVKARTSFPACNTGPELRVTQSQHPAHLSLCILPFIANLNAGVLTSQTLEGVSQV